MSALAGIGLDRRRIVRAALALVGMAIAVILIARLTTDWRAVPAEALAAFHLDPRPLGLAWGIQTLGWLLVVDTWRQVLDREGEPAGGTRLPFARHLQLYAYTSLTQVLPGSIWHPMSRIALYRPFGVPGLAISAAVVVEWMLLGVAGLILFGLAAPLARATPPSWAPLLLPLAVLAVGLLHPAVFDRLLRRAARWLGQATPPPTLIGRDVVLWLMRELGVLVCSGVALYLLMRAVSPAASLADALSVWGLSVAIASLLAWLPATALIKDASMVVLLTPLYLGAGIETGTAALIALGVTLAWRIWSAGVLVSWAALATALAGRLPAAEPAAREG